MAATAGRSILHLDLDAFYASVEELDHPAYRGKPLIVAGLGPRGVVSTASYAARSFGVRSAMPTTRARQLCPDGIYVAPRMARYQELSEQVFALMAEVTPEIEGLSLDEAFLDVTASERLLGPSLKIAIGLQDRIRTQLGLSASIGIAPNKLVAKLASESAKPGGIRAIQPMGIREFLDPLPLTAMWGVGKVLGTTLTSMGLRTVADLLALGEGPLVAAIGSFGHVLYRRCQGCDDRPVERALDHRGISAEHTFETDLGTLAESRVALMQQCERVCERSRALGLRAALVRLKLRQSDFSLVSRQKALQPPTDHTGLVYAAALRLLESWWSQQRRPAIRLLGVALGEFADTIQADLFGDAPAPAAVDRVADAIRQRFGSRSALTHARALGTPGRRKRD